MWSITFKMMRKNLRMLIPAGIAILIGTAFIASTFLFGNAMNNSLVEQVTAQFAQANYAVQPKKGLDEDEMRNVTETTIDSIGMDRIERIPGVEGVRPDAQMEVKFGANGQYVSGVALSDSKDTQLLPVDIVEGKAPISGNEVAIPQQTAEQLHVKVGDEVTLLSAFMKGSGKDAVSAKVTGLTNDPHHAFSFYGGGSIASDTLMATLYDEDSFSKVFLSCFYMRLAEHDGKVDPALVKQVEARLPGYFTLMSRDAAAEASIKSLSGNGTDITQTFLLCFGILALVVAALVIANTFQVLVAQRRRTLALLRTIGAKKTQLYASVLLEAGILGFMASALGVACAIGLMGIVSKMDALGSTGIHAALIVTWQVIVLPILFGVVMTVLASLSSARTATSVTPLEALRPLELSDQRKTKVGRAVFGLLAIAGGAIAIVFGIIMERETLQSNNYDGSQAALLLAILGCALVFLGLALTAFFWMPLLMRSVGHLVSLFGPSAQIANANIQKNPRRIAATGTALLIGVTLVATMATGAASVKASMNKNLDTRYSVDVVATGEGLTPELVKKVEAVKGVSGMVYAPTANYYSKTANGNEINVLLVGVKDVAQLKSVMHADLNGVSLDDHQVLLQKYNSNNGQEISYKGNADFHDTDEEGKVLQSGLDLKPEIVDYRNVSTNYGAVGFVNASLFTNGEIKARDKIMLLRIDTSERTLADIYDSINKALSSAENISVGGPVSERLQWEEMVNIMLMLLVALLAVAVVIALIGVANTLSLSVIERTRESATLRAIGMTTGQLRVSLAVEALFISLVASIVGIVFGTMFAWIGSYMVMSAIGPVVYPIDWKTDLIILAVAAVAALLASVFPARRAIKTPPVEALAEA